MKSDLHKIISSVACVAFVVSSMPAFGNVVADAVNLENPVAVNSTATDDGAVDISDVVLMNRVYAGVDEISEKGLANADVDQSGKIELSDSMNVLRLLVHLLDESDFPIQGS
ncbi:MAG: hypothetical protein K2H29_09765 [Oscillospiraceae bacterium]|nr:hypothetical protein [Oscillospiraceae bacterium]